MPLTITFDLEDHRASANQPARFRLMTERFLSVLAELGATATVFAVGELGQAHPELIREIADAGHELGLHGWRHTPFDQIRPRILGTELRRGRELLEDIIAAPVVGLRAPIFSLTKSTSWAIEDIAEAGFAYSSSVLPSGNPQHGWAGAPLAPFRWPGGLIELPCPVLGVGSVRVPFLGGAYMRYLPRRALNAGIARLDSGGAPWTYLHPYDLDEQEQFFVLPWAGWLASRIVLGRRGATLPRLRWAVEQAGGPGPPLGEVAARYTDAPVFIPA